MSFEVSVLADQLFPGNVGNGVRSPYLAVGMRIAGAHHGAPILEYLHVIDIWHRAQFPELGGPGMDHASDVVWRHGGEGKVVAGREADYPAEPRLAFRDQQPPVFDVQAIVANRGFEGGEV